MSDTLLTSDQLAESLQVSERTVMRWLADGTIPASIREGKVLRFDRSAVLRALSKRAKAAPKQLTPVH
jgi:excisionase family DNA binding protein